MLKPKQIRNSKGKLVNCLAVVKFVPTSAAAKKPKPTKGRPRNQAKPAATITPGNMAKLKAGIKAIIARAEREVLNQRI